MDKNYIALRIRNIKLWVFQRPEPTKLFKKTRGLMADAKLDYKTTILERKYYTELVYGRI